ncbi:MAG: hypothetical protein EA425_13440 [Puniceicoccaceae bacterium]|nr:MAG: hypothetical protein EA425_13440 [Puniceicoccaceae bacterium]
MTPHDLFEERLRRLQPAPLPPELQKRHPQKSLRSIHRWLLPLAAAAALLLVVGLGLLQKPAAPELPPATTIPGPTPTGVAGLQPVQALHNFQGWHDDGIVWIGERLPARQVRYQFLDTFSYQDPVTRTAYEIAIPREEIVFLALETF